MADALLAQDILDGATVRDRPNLFVIGSFDRRITFYSQQVRALSLIHALKELGYLHANPRIAVVGGGAAGVTAAAAAALVTESQVVLFESADALLPLQSTTDRRRLDPHIYDWPAHNATDPIANLPILDWESGACRTVRRDILHGFQDIVTRLDPRLERRLRHKVTALTRTADGYQLDITNLNAPASPSGAKLREQFHMVFLAVGFGLEPDEPVPAIQSASYWSDAGVPVAEFAARPSPRFFVSGAGDGGLIDFVAAGARDFDHAGMIRLISEHPGIVELKPILAKIDVRARAEDVDGVRFDFIAAYDAELLQRLTVNGLVAAVEQQLRPGVQLTFQTQHAELFDVSTATLNRLAAYLTIKACAGAPQRSFRHLHCDAVTRGTVPNSQSVVAPLWLDCAGETVAADTVIVRRGPQRDMVLAPFASHLASFDVTHKEWLNRYGEATLIPKLSTQARSLFQEAARSANIFSPRLLRLMGNQLPISVKLVRENANIRWSGAITPDQLIQFWSGQHPFKIILPDGPDALGAVAGAVLRVACHSSNCQLHAAPGLWSQLVRELSLNSLHAEGMAMPAIIAGDPGGAAENPVSLRLDTLARRIHRSLDGWLLDRLNAHLQPFFASNDDPSNLINVNIAQDLRVAMGTTWDVWHESFTEDPALLNHFLRLMICAVDEDDHRDAAQILVGPTKWPVILRGTAVALAIAAAWDETSPKVARPGNLVRMRDDGSEWAGHGCAADMINGDEMSLCAASFMWQTQFVILVVKSAIEVSRIAERPFAQIDIDQPGLSDTDGSGPVIMSISRDFIGAAAAGLAQLRTLLAKEEERHFKALQKTIMKGAA